YVSSKNLHAVPSRARKLLPLFVGPFKVLAYSPRTSTYIIDLPARYTSRGYSNRFHSSQVRRAFVSDEGKWPNRVTNEVPIFPLDSMTTESPLELDYEETPLGDFSARSPRERDFEFGAGNPADPSYKPAFTPAEAEEAADAVDAILNAAAQTSSLEGRLGGMVRDEAPTAFNTGGFAPTPARLSRDEEDVALLESPHTVITNHSVRAESVAFYLDEQYVDQRGNKKNKVITFRNGDQRREALLEGTLAMKAYLFKKKQQRIARLKAALNSYKTRDGVHYGELVSQNAELRNISKNLQAELDRARNDNTTALSKIDSLRSELAN
ncbi:hypothetical protein JCM11641_007935, partial [Rhodosporidiobolus odoratus]